MGSENGPLAVLRNACDRPTHAKEHIACGGLHLFAALYIVFGGIFTPAAATSNYTYGPDEYATVDGGLSRGGKYSIAAHGTGEGGNDDFHLYLMAEPGHRRIGLLDEVVQWLDTSPEAFTANWSEDSRFVALGYRIDRHLYAIKNIYRVADGRADPVAGPSLPEAIGREGRRHRDAWTSAR